MAEASLSVGQDQFKCPVCLDLLKEPVTIPCGHSYCMSCITSCWNQEDCQGVYKCPQCRQTFTTRPALCKNVVFAEMVEQLKKTKIPAVVPVGSGDAHCDICTGRKHKAVKSCLMCLESYCQNHFDRHEELHSVKPHRVTNATGRIKQMICPQHGKQLEIYCRTDQRCICYLCTMDEHKNHNTVTATAERAEKQKHLEQTQRNYQQIIQQREKTLQELRDLVKNHKCSAQKAVEDSERVFTELIRSIERDRSEVTKLIRDQETAAVSRAEGLLKQLEQENDDLRRREAEMRQLLHTDDHIHFLQVQSCPVPPKSWEITVSFHHLFNDVGKSVLQLKQKVEGFCKEELKIISDTVPQTEIFSISEDSKQSPQSWSPTRPIPKPKPRSLTSLSKMPMSPSADMGWAGSQPIPHQRPESLSRSHSNIESWEKLLNYKDK